MTRRKKLHIAGSMNGIELIQYRKMLEEKKNLTEEGRNIYNGIYNGMEESNRWGMNFKDWFMKWRIDNKSLFHGEYIKINGEKMRVHIEFDNGGVIGHNLVRKNIYIFTNKREWVGSPSDPHYFFLDRHRDLENARADTYVWGANDFSKTSISAILKDTAGEFKYRELISTTVTDLIVRNTSLSGSPLMSIYSVVVDINNVDNVGFYLNNLFNDNLELEDITFSKTDEEILNTPTINDDWYKEFAEKYKELLFADQDIVTHNDRERGMTIYPPSEILETINPLYHCAIIDDKIIQFSEFGDKLKYVDFFNEWFIDNSKKYVFSRIQGKWIKRRNAIKIIGDNDFITFRHSRVLLENNRYVKKLKIRENFNEEVDIDERERMTEVALLLRAKDLSNSRDSMTDEEEASNKERDFYNDNRFTKSKAIVYCHDVGDFALLQDVVFIEALSEYYFDIKNYNPQMLSSYHSVDRQDFSKGAKKTIGFEIEKSEFFDVEKVEGGYRGEINRTGLILERDGSVDNGFELITPTLNINTAEKYFEKSSICRFTDIETDDSAGGHISIGLRTKKNGRVMNGAKIMGKVRHWLALLYVLYNDRLENGYSTGQTFDDIQSQRVPTKGTAIASYSYRLEFRIIPAVRSYNQLVWRLNLMKIFLSNLDLDLKSTIDLLRNKKSKIFRLLMEKDSPLIQNSDDNIFSGVTLQHPDDNPLRKTSDVMRDFIIDYLEKTLEWGMLENGDSIKYAKELLKKEKRARERLETIDN